MLTDGQLALNFFQTAAARAGLALQRRNIFYLLSALLMLAGCYTVCLPYLMEFQEILPLLKLLAAINTYECMVILACGFIMRHLPRNSEINTLLLVEMLFLLDVTFTVNGCLPIHWRHGLLICVLSLVLAFVKIWLLERLAGTTIFSGIRPLLFPVLVFVYVFQILLAYQPLAEHASNLNVVCLLWIVVGTLPLLVIFCAEGLAPEAHRWRSAEASPWWMSSGFRRAVVLLALGVPLAHLAGQCWVRSLPLSPVLLLPVIASVLAVYPLWNPKVDPFTLGLIRVGALGNLMLVTLCLQSHAWRVSIHDVSLRLSDWRLCASFTALVLLFMWLRERRVYQLNLFFAAWVACVFGRHLGSVVRCLAEPDWRKLLACLPLLAYWLYHERRYLPVLGMASFWLLLWTRAIAAAHPGLPAETSFARYWPVLAFLLSLHLQERQPLWRGLLLLAMCCLGVGGDLACDRAALVYFYTVSAAFVAAMRVERRSYVMPLGIYILSAHLLQPSSAPTDSPLGWGWLFIALAFALFGVGVFVTTRGLGAENGGALSTNTQPRG